MSALRWIPVALVVLAQIASADPAARIIDMLRDMAGEKTLVIISHRLSAVRHADQIAVMEKGRIVTTGSHAQLMAAGGYYARAHGLQELEDAI